ncbi:helix-turn-helix domain-containing protein [Carnobacterium maltaromaticum]|uniref:helix-turn-helix domain-containing protein n=1 Tax=Carnobacterium maltaromaticum TaxID=2751 RepID=UPI00295E3ECD|nr:helix-turn-helix domain-containing protein [Carnobacterium maltaromaticum]
MLEKVDKVIHRKIKIMEILDASERGVKIEKLANVLNLSLKTVKNELSGLEIFLKENVKNVEIIKIKNKYQLMKPTIICIDLIYLSIKKESIYFYLIRATFFRKLLKKEHRYLLEYLSPSSLYKYKLQFKTHLKQNELDFNMAELTIEGSESSKRFFYFNFFWENYRGVEWPFDNISRKSLILKIEKSGNEFFNIMSEIEKESFLYWIAVIITRINDGFFFQKDAFYSKVKISDHVFKESPKLYELMRVLLPKTEEIHLKIEANFLYYFFSLTTEYSLSKNNILNELCEYSGEYSVAKLTGSIINKFNCSFEVREKKLIDVHFSIYKLLVYELYYPELARKLSLSYTRNYIPIKMFELEFRIFYQDFLKSWEKKGNESLFNGLLFLFSKLIEINKYFPMISVTLLTSQGFIYKEVLENKIMNLPYNIIIKEPNTSNVNIIISDFKINKLVEAEVFYWNQKPTEKDWKVLKKKFEELQKKYEYD